MPFFVSGMRYTISVTLEARTCTRFTVPLAGTLRDVDIEVFDDAGQMLAADVREEGEPLVEACTRESGVVHVLVRVVRGAGHVRLVQTTAPWRDAARSTRGTDVVEEAFIDLEEGTTTRTLRTQAAALSRRGFTRTEPIATDVVPETRAIELPIAVGVGECVTVSIVSQAEIELAMLDADGQRILRASYEGDLASMQTCAAGALRAVVSAAPGTRIEVLIAHGRALDVGGPSGLWLGHSAD
jgi:hypothetical protein